MNICGKCLANSQLTYHINVGNAIHHLIVAFPVLSLSGF